ncbi:Vanadium-dependent bromoperoxidase [Nymphon striatum]|nr:Vanadium-dependent bromoperoxidase [Nymphon striatum]
MDWSEVAPDVRAALEHQLGAPVVSWSSQEEGFSPGMAARCMLENGSRAFVKAVNGATDEHARLFGLNELHVHKGLPVGAPAPRLLASVTDDDWVAGAWQDIDGRLPGSPWSESDLRLVFATLDGLRLEPAEGMSHLADRDMSLSGWRKLREQGRSDIEPWIDASVTNTLAEMESTWTQACPPDAFVHGDIRADNLLIDDDDQVWIVDWAHAMAGPAWFDHIAMIPSIAMQSGRSAADLWAMSAYATTVEPTAVDAVVAAVAGFLTEAARQPPLAVIPILVRLVQVLRGDQRVGRSRIGHFALVQIDRVDWKRGRDRSAEHADHGWIAKWSAFEPGDREVPGEVALAGFAYIAKRGGDGCSHVFQPGDGKHDDARSEQADFGAQAHLCSRRVECLECRERFMPLAVTQKAHRDVPLAALGPWCLTPKQTSEERLGFFLGGTAASIFDSDVAEDLLYVRTAPLPRRFPAGSTGGSLTHARDGSELLVVTTRLWSEAERFLDDFVPRSPAEARRIRAYRIREHAASLAAEEPLPNHVVNGDERPDLDYALSFTKGLPHDHNTGLLSDPADYEQFVYATKTGKAQDFLATPLGPRTGFRTVDGEYELRAWESQGIGHAFDLVGPDPQSVTMPPPPAVGSPELTAEMAEVYAQAILRDEPLSALRLGYAGQHAPRRNDRFTQ